MQKQVSAEALGVGMYKHNICGALITTRMANDRQGAKAAQDARSKSAKSNVAEREACTELKSWPVNSACLTTHEAHKSQPGGQGQKSAQANSAKSAIATGGAGPKIGTSKTRKSRANHRENRGPGTQIAGQVKCKITSQRANHGQINAKIMGQTHNCGPNKSRKSRGKNTNCGPIITRNSRANAQIAGKSTRRSRGKHTIAGPINRVNRGAKTQIAGQLLRVIREPTRKSRENQREDRGANTQLRAQ
ncbi:hypothetical protein FB451DRAFT_1164227 [Mycena latifolia]|nr:hypothetical protein FB451DRAFT_1164227 [Mycena latifolia]